MGGMRAGREKKQAVRGRGSVLPPKSDWEAYEKQATLGAVFPQTDLRRKTMGYKTCVFLALTQHGISCTNSPAPFFFLPLMGPYPGYLNWKIDGILNYSFGQVLF